MKEKVKTNVSAEKGHVGELIKLSGFTKDNKYLEIGTRFGQSLYMAITSDPNMQIISVDKHQMPGVVKAYGDRVRFVEMASDRACRRMASHGEKISACFIDGDHSEEWVARDIRACWDLWDKSGFLSGHDFTKRKGYGVIKAVSEFFGIENVTRIDRRWKCRGGELHIMHTVWVFIPDESMPKYAEYLSTL